MLSFLIFSSFLILCTSLPTQLYALFFKKKKPKTKKHTHYLSIRPIRKKLKYPNRAK